MGCGSSSSVEPERGPQPTFAKSPRFSASGAVEPQPVLLLGADGSFQIEDGRRMATRLGGTYLQYNQLVKDAITTMTEAGSEIEQILISRQAVPAALILRVLAPIMYSSPAPHVLEGFPRSFEHFEALEAEVGPCLCSVSFDVPEAEVLRNLESRGIPKATSMHKLQLHQKKTVPLIRKLELRGVLTTVSGTNAMDRAGAAVQYALSVRAAEHARIEAAERQVERKAEWQQSVRDEDARLEAAERMEAEERMEAAERIEAAKREVEREAEAVREAIRLGGSEQALVMLQAMGRSVMARNKLQREQSGVVKWQALARGKLTRNRIAEARPEPIERAMVIRHSRSEVQDEPASPTARRLAPWHADLSSITLVARNNHGLFFQPANPRFKIGLVQIYVRGAPFGGDDKSENGHRYDMAALANGLIRAEMSCTPFHYRHEEHYKFLSTCSAFDALLLRFPRAHIEQDGGRLAKFDEAMHTLQNEKGVLVWPPPGTRKLPDAILQAFAGPAKFEGGLPQDPDTGENSFFDPPVPGCAAACCTELQPRASWIDVTEDDMMGAIYCGTRIAEAMAGLLEAEERRVAGAPAVTYS